MDINSILQGVKCDCGKNHRCNIECVYIEKGAVKRLQSICLGYNNILIVADENTYMAAGNMVENNLIGKEVTKIIFDGKTILVPDERAIAKINENLTNVELIIGIGSGVIQDLCKYVSFFFKKNLM